MLVAIITILLINITWCIGLIIYIIRCGKKVITKENKPCGPIILGIRCDGCKFEDVCCKEGIK